MSRAAIRYAKAILSLASDKNEAKVVNDDMELMAESIAQSSDLAMMLNSAVIKSDDKQKALLAVFPKLNANSIKLIELLKVNKRLDILNHVAAKYTTLFDELEGKEAAIVTTAVPLTDDLKSKVLAKLKELSSKTVALKSVVDETILGGFILRVGDKQYDASVASKLNNLKREFTLN